MLDQDLVQQLKVHFHGLGHAIELVVDRSRHAQQEELLQMLGEVASASPELTVRVGEQEASVPSFELHVDGAATGVRFRGIPGGHEFSSLVLAILNAARKGKLPDAALAQRIRALREGGVVHTYVSLSCENCPDVVQALNQIALVHGGLVHVTVDGALVQDEVAALGIQGVPSIVIDGKLVHSGRATLAQLLDVLEAELGRDPGAITEDVDLGRFDVAVIGGGPAGVSAAIYSARKGLKTALIAEQLGGQVQQTKGIENLISVVYTEGPALSASLDQHLRAYPVEVLEHRRVQEVRVLDAGKELRLHSGEHLVAETVIVATGAKWRELGVPGEKEHIGRGVAFCPHCDGPYYKGKKVAVVGGGNSGVEAAIDLAGTCSEVVLLEFMPELKADAVLLDKLRALGNVQVIVQAKTTGVVGDGEKVVALEYEDRRDASAQRLALDGVFVQIGLSPNSGVVKGLVETTRHGEIVVDDKGRTSVPGIYAAGDVTTTPYKQIVIAIGEGAKVALSAFEDRMRGAVKPAGDAVKALSAA
jgi:alkyl hydroperoxide reductase subunit F